MSDLGFLGRLLRCLVLGILPSRGLAAVDELAFISVQCLHFSGRLSSAKIAETTIDALYGIDEDLRDLIEAKRGVVVRCVLLRVDAIYGAGIDRRGCFLSRCKVRQ